MNPEHEHTTPEQRTPDPWWLTPGQRVILPIGTVVDPAQQPPVVSAATVTGRSEKYHDARGELWWFAVDLPPGIPGESIAQLYHPSDVLGLWSGL